jgi:hypothetical protein
MFPVEIRRDGKVTLYPFVDYFKDFEKVEAVRKIFGEKTDDVLNNLKLEFCSRRGYMGVNQHDGHVIVNVDYLRDGEERDLYLDVVHELVHVKQFFEGKDLFDDAWEYVDRPTEVEAYQVAVNEARRIGMSDDEIYEYLKMERISFDQLERLAKSVGVRIPR